jgi:MarR family transcriptional regulator, organic hydroperoxide resistance regulator
MVRPKPSEVHAGQRHAAKLMKRILGHLRTSLDEELRPHGVTIAQIQLLWAIRNAPGSSGAQLSRQCEVTPQTAQALIQRIEEAGWIVRGKDSVNDRIVTASLTPAGEKVLSTADHLVKNIEAKLWQGIPPPAIHELIDVLEKCLRNISRE